MAHVACWGAAVNAEGSFGRWAYAVAKKPGEVAGKVEEAGSAEQGGQE